LRRARRGRDDERHAAARQPDRSAHYALVSLDYAREPDLRVEQMAAMTHCSKYIHTFRSLGSAALSLCYVGAGWLEAYFHWALIHGTWLRVA